MTCMGMLLYCEYSYLGLTTDKKAMCCIDMLDIIQYGAWMEYGALETIVLVAKLHKVVVYL